MSVPTWYELLLLGLAAFRTWKLLGTDTVLDPLRDRLVGDRDEYRQSLDEFIRCPWCLGFWCATGWWVAWLVWPHTVLVLAAWGAVAAVVGLLAHWGTD